MPWNVVTFELYWLTFMYTTHQTNNLNSGFCFTTTVHLWLFIILALCHFILLWMCFHQSPNALPPQTQHNFWNGLEALAPASKLMQKCCLYSHRRPLYVVEGCFLLSTLYQWRTSGNHRGHLHYNSWWISGATGIPFEHSCPQRLGNEATGHRIITYYALVEKAFFKHLRLSLYFILQTKDWQPLSKLIKNCLLLH